MLSIGGTNDIALTSTVRGTVGVPGGVVYFFVDTGFIILLDL